MAKLNGTHKARLTREAKELENLGPAFDDATAQRMDKGASDKSRGIDRRLALVICTKSLKEVHEMSKSDPESYSDIVAACERFEAFSRSMLDVAEAALVRVTLADARDNAPSLARLAAIKQSVGNA